MKNMLFVLFLLIGSAAFAQDAQQTKNPVGNEQLLKGNTVLAELAKKVNAAQVAVSTSSRANATQAQADLKTACDAYRAELKKQLAVSADPARTEALNRELNAVNTLSPEAVPAEAVPSKR